MTEPQSGKEQTEAENLVPLTEERIREIIREEVTRILLDISEQRLEEAQRLSKFLRQFDYFRW